MLALSYCKDQGSTYCICKKIFQENDFWKDPSYSTEDLLLLWQFEKNFLKKELLQQRSRNETNLNKIINSYLKYLDYDMYVEKYIVWKMCIMIAVKI